MAFEDDNEFHDETDVKPSAQVKQNPEQRDVVLHVISGPSAGKQQVIPRGGCLVGRSDTCAVRIHDSAVSRKHAKITVHGGVPRIQDLGSKFGVLVEGERCDARDLQDGERIHLSAETVVCIRFQDPRETALLNRLRAVASRDALTGIANRHYLNERLQQEYSFSMRHNVPFAILMVDLDHFKEINDGAGHGAGDQVLCEFSALLCSLVRCEDVVARYGGDEFMIICRDSVPPLAVRFGERLCENIRDHKIGFPGVDVTLTASIGIAAVMPGSENPPGSVEELLARVDTALYQAKRNGRDQVALWAPPEGERHSGMTQTTFNE